MTPVSFSLSNGQIEWMGHLVWHILVEINNTLTIHMGSKYSLTKFVITRMMFGKEQDMAEELSLVGTFNVDNKQLSKMCEWC